MLWVVVQVPITMYPESKGYNSYTTCTYCKKHEYDVFDCCKLKRKIEREEREKKKKETDEVNVVDLDSDVTVLAT